MRLHTLFSALILVFSVSILTACNEKAETTTDNTDQSQTFEWKMVSTWPPNFPVFQEGADLFAEQINIMSNGRLKIKVFAGGELVPALQSFDAVSQGAAEMGHGAAYYWAGKVPAAQFMSSVPFGMNANGMNAWFYGGNGLKMWNKLYKRFGIKPLPMGNTGVQMGGWFNKKIETLDDLKGLKMRIPGIGGKVLARAGGTPILLSGGEIYTALERGTIDATEWVGPYHDQRLGLHRAAKYYYTPGWHEPGTTLELIINQKAWDGLPADLQKMVEVSAMSINQWMNAQFNAMNLNALRELKEKHNVTVLNFPPEVLAKLKKITTEVLQEEAAKDADFQWVYENFKGFSASMDDWNTNSEIAYHYALHPESNISDNVKIILKEVIQ